MKRGRSCAGRLLLKLAAAGLLSLEVLVQKVKSLLVGLSATHDGEHAFARLVMGSLGDGDPGSRAPADLGDLATTSANDAANHVSGDADVLCLDFLAIFGDKRVTTVAGVGVGSPAVATGLVAEVGTVTGAVVRTAVVAIADALVHGAGARGSSNRRTDGGVIQDSTGTALPVVNQALSNFPDGLLDTLGGALHFDDTLGRLGEHFLLRDHAHARRILDVLDLETLASDDGTHLVVRDQKPNGYTRVSFM